MVVEGMRGWIFEFCNSHWKLENYHPIQPDDKIYVIIQSDENIRDIIQLDDNINFILKQMINQN